MFQGMEVSGSNIKKFLIFSHKKAFLIFPKWNFLIFREAETPKKFSIFQKTELFQETSYISRSNFSSSKSKKKKHY